MCAKEDKVCLRPTQEWGVAWDLREMWSAQGKGVREGQAPHARREGEGRVRRDEEEPACTEWAPSKRLFNNVIKCMLMMLELILRLFQENKSYGVKHICIYPLMSRYFTSLRLSLVWYTEKLLEICQNRSNRTAFWTWRLGQNKNCLIIT